MEQTLKIERLGHQGDGIGTLNGQQVFAPFTVAGEEVSGEINGDRMDTPRIVTPVPERIKPVCRHFKTCGGCAVQHVRDDVVSDWKNAAVRRVLEHVGLTPEFREIATSPERTRRRATFSGRRTKKGAMIGFHGRKSDQLVEIKDCTLIDPAIRAGFDGFIELVMLAGSRKSEVRIGVTQSLNGLDISLQDAKPMDPKLISEVGRITHAHGFARVAWNGDVLLEVQPPHQQFGAARVTPTVNAFLQATPHGEAALVSAIKEIVGKSKTVVDLFAGCGTFALPLASGADIHAVEGDADMMAALDEGWRHANLHRVTTETRNLFRRPLLANELSKFDAIVIDPPRAGAVSQVAELAKSTVSTIAFASCNPATFARDAAVLVAAGYTLDWVQVVDQFRWSAHCELIGKFTRA